MSAPRPLAAVYLQGDGQPFSVAQTVGEVIWLIEQAEKHPGDHDRQWPEMTLAGTDGGTYDGKPVRIRASRIVAVGPPMRMEEDD